jgi:hypothetical protein
MDALEELLHKQAITEVLYRYCRGIDRMDRELVVSCWHPDGTAEYEGIYSGTGEGFVDWVWPVHREGFVGHSHQVTNVLVQVGADGAQAVSEAYVTVALHAAGNGGVLVGRGRYLDRWSRRDGVWAIDHRRHVSDVSSSATAAGAAEPGIDRRSSSDPSYELFGGRA